MKYLKIKLEDNKSVLVDESAERSSKGFYVMVDETSILYKKIDEHKGTHERNNQWVKIIATINHSISLDVPMVVVEDEVEKIALNMMIDISKKQFLSLGTLANIGEGIILGYKAAQQKGTYSDEDLRKAMEEVIKWWNSDTFEKYDNVSCIEDFGDIFIQSLKQEYIELEMEAECCKKYTSCNTNCRYDNETVWKIKTNRVNGQLIAYVKK